MKKSKKGTGILAFTALYSVMMIFVLAATVFVLSHEKLQSTEITKYVVETEYVYITASTESEETTVSESTEECYCGRRIGIRNSDRQRAFRKNRDLQFRRRGNSHYRRIYKNPPRSRPTSARRGL